MSKKMPCNACGSLKKKYALRTPRTTFDCGGLPSLMFGVLPPPPPSISGESWIWPTKKTAANPGHTSTVMDIFRKGLSPLV